MGCAPATVARRGRVSPRATRTQSATAVQGTCVGFCAWAAPSTCSRARASRAGLTPSSIPIEGAHLQHTCQVFPQARGRVGARWLPRHRRQPSPPIRPVRTSPSPSTAGATRLAWWHELWYSLSVA
jgi:hypothetical protein